MNCILRALHPARSLTSLVVLVVVGCSIYDPSLATPAAPNPDPSSAQGGQSGQGGDFDTTGSPASTGTPPDAGNGGDGAGGAMVASSTATGGSTTSSAGGMGTVGTSGTGTSGTGAGGIATGGGNGNSGGGVNGGAGDGAAVTSGTGGNTTGSGSGGGSSGCSAACALDTGCPGRSCWTATANPTPPSMFDKIPDTRLQPRYAIDGDETTRYSTGEFANGGEWFEVDLCRAVRIDEVDTFTDAASDVAASYTVQVSTDGVSWSTVLTSSSPATQRQSLTFTPVLARYVRYNQTGMVAGWWSLGEFSVVCAP